MSSLEKALEIVAHFSPNRPSLGVSQVAEELGMPKSTVSRLMKTMATAGLLERKPEGRAYVPGVLAFQLGSLYQSHLRILDLVEEAVISLVQRYGLTGYVGVLNGSDVVLIGIHQGSFPIRLVLDQGTRVPAHVTAIGQALLSRKTEAEIRDLYPADISYDETGVISTPDDIVALAAEARSAGCAAVEGVTFRGFNAVAAAVESASERISVGFSLSYPQELLAGSDLGEILGTLIRTAQDIGVRTADPYWVKRGPALLEDTEWAASELQAKRTPPGQNAARAGPGAAGNP